MKTFTLVKVLISTLFLLVVPISCEKGKQVIEKKTDNTAEVRRLTIIGDAYFDKSEFSNALQVYEKVITISDSVKDRVDYVDALISIALIKEFEGNYLESEATATKVLPHLKYLKKPRFAWETYKIFVENYLAANDYDNALIYAKKAYNLKTSARRKTNALANIALVYMRQKHYKKAIKVYKKLTTYGYYGNKKKTNTFKDFELQDYAIMKNNIGICYADLGDSRALLYYQEALKIRLKLNDLSNLSHSYSGLSQFYLKSNLSLAKKYAKIAYKYSCKINAYSQKKNALKILIKSSRGNELKKYSEIYIQFTDSVNKSQLTQKEQSANIKYNFKKDREENLELKAQKAEDELEMQRQKNRSIVSYIIITVSALSLLFVVFYITKKGKRDRANEIFKNEMRISEKLQFELEKDIDKILLFTEKSDLEKEENKEQFLSHLNNIYSKTRNISRENSEILTDENFEKVLKEMISGYATPNLNILINGLNAFSWSKIDRVKKITVFRVVQEIFNQVKNHKNSSLASITFKMDQEEIIITYADNSSVTHDQNNLNERFANIENRLKLIKGTFNVFLNQNQGFKVSIKFPI
ncbi:tetratricopeptide repeat protein [Flavobacterium sp. HBTb2-11-1]|uniref:ATP-binding protein n=1 Tax=Flavobacterium sp. HBTb2-11-1 TaxID=2692212 RepID=UPI00136DC7C0|nr:tetratricopeptide repeat protein [Flavobacterium sp. HBTb2-11-1]MXO06278.1 tetratricopeptide repeat protein [Flavobacterium sp. HBTb2-11-1]